MLLAGCPLALRSACRSTSLRPQQSLSCHERSTRRHASQAVGLRRIRFEPPVREDLRARGERVAVSRGSLVCKMVWRALVCESEKKTSGVVGSLGLLYKILDCLSSRRLIHLKSLTTRSRSEPSRAFSEQRICQEDTIFVD